MNNMASKLSVQALWLTLIFLHLVSACGRQDDGQTRDQTESSVKSRMVGGVAQPQTIPSKYSCAVGPGTPYPDPGNPPPDDPPPQDPFSAATLDEESPSYCEEIYNSRQEPARRMADIRTHLRDLEREVRDLEALLTDLILGFSSRSEIQAVREELFRARAYEGELRTAEQCWHGIIGENKQVQKDTRDLAR